jgi:hypothetical protein
MSLRSDAPIESYFTYLTFPNVIIRSITPVLIIHVAMTTFSLLLLTLYRESRPPQPPMLPEDRSQSNLRSDRPIFQALATAHPETGTFAEVAYRQRPCHKAYFPSRM